jgi:PIN domain nuclease of toxin-antitoxin system
MKYLLDTHALIWFAEADVQLSPKAKIAIELPTNSVFVSRVSLWEMAIKLSIGKLALSRSLSDVIQQIESAGIELLPLEISHILLVQSLPYTHRDPFDRMLIAQALSEGMTLVSNEGIFDQYGVARLW